MKKKRIVAVMMLMLLFLLCGCSQISSKQDAGNKESLSLSVTYGYNSCVKYGRDMSVTATVTNQGDAFQGKFQTILPTDDNNHVAYEKEIKIPSGETVEVTLNVPVSTSYHNVKFCLADEEGTVLLSKNAKMDIIGGMDKIMIGILSDSDKAMNYLSNNNTTKIFFLDAEQLPEDSLGYDTLDALVINDYDTSTLSDKQYAAIKGFVNNGGTLVLGTGETAEKTLAIFQDEFFSIHVDQVLEISNILGSKSTKQVISTTVEGGKELDSSDGKPVIWQVDKGKGNIQVIGFDLALNSTEWNTLGSLVLGNITEHFSKTMTARMQSEYNGQYNSYGVYNCLGVADDKNIPSIGLYVIVLLLYIILIGPPLYFVLKKRDKRHYTWGIIPVAALVFATIIFGIGGKTRMNKPFLGFVSFIEVNRDMTANDNTFFSITAPYNTNYDISVDNKYHLSNMNYRSGYYEVQDEEKQDLSEYKTAINYGVNDTTIALKDYAAFQAVYFETNSSLKLDGNYESQLNLLDFKMDGTFTNNLGFDLSNAAIFSNHVLVNVGDVKNQEKVSVTGSEQATIASRDTLANSDILSSIAGGNAYEWNTDSDASRRYYTLEYYLGNHFDSLESGSYLIGFDYSGNNTGVVGDLGMQSAGVRLVILPINVNMTKDGRTYLSTINNYMNIISGDYDSTYGAIITNQLKMEYQFNPTDKILELQYTKELNTEFIKDYWSGFYGTISAFNYNTKEYDEMFVGGKVGECKDLTNYISKDNKLSLLYIVDKTAQNKYSIVLPTISAVKEAR